MKDFQAILQAYKKMDFGVRKAALATVVRVHGSSYRRPGARMLIADDGRWTGSISGGCLEGDALRKARQVIDHGRPMKVTYDTREESNQNLGISLGCHGVIDVLFEAVRPDSPENPMTHFAQFAGRQEPLALLTVLSGARMGEKCAVDHEKKIVIAPSFFFSPALADAVDQLFATKKSVTLNTTLDGEEAECFLEYLQPELSLIIFGGGFDARPVHQLARSLGWSVEVTDECVAHLAPAFFPEARKLSLCHRDFIDRQIHLTPYTACVLMSHNYEYDRDVLRKIIHSAAPYIGILGPRNRFDRMLAELRGEGLVVSDQDLQRIHAPIGLDIGAEAADEIAVSIVAEIRSKFSARPGGFLKDLPGPIHARESADEVLKSAPMD